MFFFSLAFTWLLAYLADKTQQYSSYITVAVILNLSLISGLREKYNDTERYIYNFKHLIPSDIDSLFLDKGVSLGENPGFQLYQYILKSFIFDNPYFFIFISALITNSLIVSFYKKYAVGFSFSVFLYITSGLFVLGMAALKQMLAIAIGIWAIHFFVKKKYGLFFLVIFLAATVHQFVFLYLVVFLINDEVWTKKILFAFFIVLLIGAFFSQFINTVLTITSSVGEKYDESFFSAEKGANIFRILVFSVTPILSFLYRKQINEQGTKMLIIVINFSVISLLFMIIASFGGANMFGRMASYFEPFTYLALPLILYRLVPRKKSSATILLSSFFYMALFYYQIIIVTKFDYKSITIF